jgi:hypothetical protein
MNVISPRNIMLITIKQDRQMFSSLIDVAREIFPTRAYLPTYTKSKYKPKHFRLHDKYI